MQRTTHTRPKREVAERREGGREQPSTPHMKTIGTLRIGGGNYSTATTEGEGTEGDEPDIGFTGLNVRDVEKRRKRFELRREYETLRR